MRVMRFATISAALALFSILAGCSQGEWKEFTDSKNGFTVQFPGSPKIDVDTQQVGNGVSTTTTEYTVDPKYGVVGNKYTVAVSEINAPNRDEMEFPVQDALQGGKQGIKSQGGSITGEKTITHNGKEGWEFEVSSGNTDSTLRMFISEADWRIYVVEVARKKGKSVDADREKFFNSFSLTASE